VLLKETDADLLVKLTSDRIDKSLQQLLLNVFVITRFDFFNAWNRLVEKLFHILKWVLIHLVYATHVSNWEVENAASFSNWSVEVSRFIYYDFDLFGFSQVFFYILASTLADFQVVDECVVVENRIGICICQVLENLRLKTVQLIFAVRDRNS